MLDAFQRMTDAYDTFETLYGDTDTDMTADDFAANAEAELLNMINRVPQGYIAAADRGTAFNEAVDSVAEGRTGVLEPAIAFRTAAGLHAWTFDTDLVQSVAQRFPSALRQIKCEAPLEVDGRTVTLYGYPDEVQGAEIFDIKTTASYAFGKYADHWQHRVYPYCMVESGQMTECRSFTYVVAVLGKPDHTKTARGRVYEEVYTYDHGQAREDLAGICRAFMEWAENRRAFITSGRLWGLSDPDGYAGIPADPELLK